MHDAEHSITPLESNELRVRSGKVWVSQGSAIMIHDGAGPATDPKLHPSGMETSRSASTGGAPQMAVWGTTRSD